MAKADGVDMTKHNMNQVLNYYDRIFSSARVDNMKEILKNLK
ncbi:MAG: hypothetical protein QF701_02795 [Nitrospinota bacterium]|jgi:biotin synthase-like enzyme|nr:hypothetical protein [Nitrospinota bacterium]MDP7662761.1 hypothetical protein [Nitrospinota bacterium]